MNVERKRDLASLSLVSLYEISKILSSSTNLAAALRAVLNLMSSYLEMRRGVVAIVDETGALEIVASCPGRAVGDAASADLPQEVARRILAGQMPFVTENVADHPLLVDYIGASGALDGERVSLIGVPIKTFGRPFGVLAVARVWTDANEISFGDDVRLLTMVANLIAQTVRLHQRVSERTAAAVRPSVAAPLKPVVRKTLKAIGDNSIVGLSKAMQEVYAQIHLVAPTRSTVVLRGESGTGKELIARAVHMLSPRKDKPFHQGQLRRPARYLARIRTVRPRKGRVHRGQRMTARGASSWPTAARSFSTRSATSRAPFQAKLLRVLQEREFERGRRHEDAQGRCPLRLRDQPQPGRGGREGRLPRRPLLSASTSCRCSCRPLRERREDIPALAEHFLRAVQQGQQPLDAVRRHGPGGAGQLQLSGQRPRARELRSAGGDDDDRRGDRGPQHAVPDEAVPLPGAGAADRLPFRRAAAARSVARIERDDRRAPALGTKGAATGETTADAEALEPRANWDDIDNAADLNALPQRDRLIRVMEKAGWVQAKAARILGLTPRQVGYALRKHNIPIKTPLGPAAVGFPTGCRGPDRRRGPGDLPISSA